MPAALDHKVFGPAGLLPDDRYADVLDKRVLDITLRDLLQHSGGWYSSVYEPHDLVTIAKEMGVAAPAGAADVIEFMLREQTLQFSPGTRYGYSNFGYFAGNEWVSRFCGLCLGRPGRLALKFCRNLPI